MCDVRIGRTVVATASPDTLVSQASYDGDRVKLTAWAVGTPDQVTGVVEILRAYQDAVDEPVVPVVCTCDVDHLSGYYRVASMSASQVKSSRVDLAIDLERVLGFAAPLFESVIVGGQRASSDSGLVTGKAWHAVPAAQVGYETGVLTPSTATLASETGDLLIMSEATNHLYNGRPSWYLAPGDWYDGAVTLVVGGNLVAGRQCQNLPAGWTISNGLIQVTGKTSGVETQLWNATSKEWGTPGTWVISRTVGASAPYTIDPLGPAHTITVLRNDPACVTIRCAYDAAALVSGSRFVVYVDYSLRRGSTVVEVTLSTRGEYRWSFAAPIVYASLTRAYDSTTDGTFISTDDGELSIQPAAGLCTFGAGPTVAAQFRAWGFGYLAGQTQQVVAQYYAAAQAERVQVVAR